MTRVNLGNALVQLGERESGTGMLTEAWAANCAQSLRRARERDVTEAVAAYRAGGMDPRRRKP